MILPPSGDKGRNGQAGKDQPSADVEVPVQGFTQHKRPEDRRHDRLSEKEKRAGGGIEQGEAVNPEVESYSG